MAQTPSRIVQISDIHLYGDKTRSLLGVNTEQSFDAILACLREDRRKPDAILLTGDLSQDASEIAYQRIADKLNAFSVPVYCIPGNHDDSEVMDKVFPRGPISNSKNILFDNWQIILLDSHIPDEVEGNLEINQFQFLQQSLNKHPRHHTIVIFHHQPVDVGSAWLDKLGLRNADELWDFLKNYPQVSTIIFGHVHQVHEGKKNKIRYYSAPSCCIQFKPDSVDFALDNIPPGYRWIELYPSGKLKTEVCRLPHYVGTFQADAKGY